MRINGYSWVGSLGLLFLVNCVQQSCLVYACIAAAQLHGDVQVPASVKVIDAEYCAGEDCEQATFDATSSPSCSPFEEGICLSGEGETRAASVVWQGGASPRNKPYSIKLTDHDTGQVLLDETRSLTGHVGPQQDDCHDDCWSAEATW